MVKCSLQICAIILSIKFLFIATEKAKCKICVPKEKCPIFGNMNKQEQEKWIIEYSCQNSYNNDYITLEGFSKVAKGDYICCHNSTIWEIEDGNNHNRLKHQTNQQSDDNNNKGQQNYNQEQVYNYESPNSNINDFKRMPNVNGRTDYNHESDNTNPNSNYWSSGYPSNEYKYSRNTSNRPQIAESKFNTNNNINNVNLDYRNLYVPSQNPYINGVNSNGNSFGRTNLEKQCAALTSFPPDPIKGCCGRDVSDADRITGGKNTELEQFPWTVLLKTTFNYGTKESTFSCGGSIISSKYILTAAHCFYEEGATVSGVEVYLAEYDKRTFPMDCVIRHGEGQKCVENILMHADEVILHPEYDDARLQNDIALLRLREKAPYTDYIRPICLPSFDIDNPDFSNLRLEVAGWGRNGNQVSDVKQSTTVNLVPQRVCMRHYPHLTRRHLCAAGYTGEDTCKGDSGGPLMIVYQGKYFVSGIVSGKRADSPCGTSVPSLYTNVFHYLQWINSNIRN